MVVFSLIELFGVFCGHMNKAGTQKLFTQCGKRTQSVLCVGGSLKVSWTQRDEKQASIYA